MKVLFLYPNFYGMNMLPTGVGLLISHLSKAGHTSEIFDTTQYINWFGEDNDKKKTENLEIRKIQDYWKNQEPIPWIRVHKLPVFTRFNHKRHVRAGVECQSCHGAVQKMQRVEQVSSLKMGWCITCHEENQASRDCLVCHY